MNLYQCQMESTYVYQYSQRSAIIGLRNVALDHHCQGTIVGLNIKNLKIKMLVIKPCTCRIWHHHSHNRFIGRTLIDSYVKVQSSSLEGQQAAIHQEPITSHHLNPGINSSNAELPGSVSPLSSLMQNVSSDGTLNAFNVHTTDWTKVIL